MKHTNERLEERFNITISRKELQELNLNIQGVENTIPCMFIKKKSNRLSEWLILVNNRWTVCYYDKNKNSIVTFIDNYYLEDFSWIERCTRLWMTKTNPA
jgi:hypothetical protein